MWAEPLKGGDQRGERQGLEGWISQLRGRGADVYAVPAKG